MCLGIMKEMCSISFLVSVYVWSYSYLYWWWLLVYRNKPMYETQLRGTSCRVHVVQVCFMFIDFLSPKSWAPKKSCPKFQENRWVSMVQKNPTAQLPSCERNATAMTSAQGHSGRVCPCTPWNRPATPSALSTLLAWCEGSHHRHGGSWAWHVRTWSALNHWNFGLWIHSSWSLMPSKWPTQTPNIPNIYQPNI